jgi:hypothetical protein
MNHPDKQLYGTLLRVLSSAGFDVDNIALLERKFICS